MPKGWDGAHKKSGELRALMIVVNNRLSHISTDEFPLQSIDPVLWVTLAEQLKDAAKLALVISKEVQK